MRKHFSWADQALLIPLHLCYHACLCLWSEEVMGFYNEQPHTALHGSGVKSVLLQQHIQSHLMCLDTKKPGFDLGINKLLPEFSPDSPTTISHSPTYQSLTRPLSRGGRSTQSQSSKSASTCPKNAPLQAPLEFIHSS